MYEQRYDAAFMDRLRSELGGGLEHLCLRLMSGARGHAEEGNNLTESPEAIGIFLFIYFKIYFILLHIIIFFINY